MAARVALRRRGHLRAGESAALGHGVTASKSTQPSPGRWQLEGTQPRGRGPVLVEVRSSEAGTLLLLAHEARLAISGVGGSLQIPADPAAARAAEALAAREA